MVASVKMAVETVYDAERQDLRPHGAAVRLLREELQLLQEPGSYVGEVIKVRRLTVPSALADTFVAAAHCLPMMIPQRSDKGFL